jgi:DNA-binding transcriptional ArsR family regulator
MSRPVVRITDARVLRALAHPLREELYYALAARGSARAADLARELDIPANQVSFHLRIMAKYGFIEEAPELARDRRDRVWRPASEYGFDIDDKLAGAEGTRAAARRHHHQLIDAFFDRGQEGAYISRDIPARLTQAEAEQLTSEITELLLGWTRRGREPGDEPRQTYLINAYIQPLPRTSEDQQPG